jgi:hypothetical protein
MLEAVRIMAQGSVCQPPGADIGEFFPYFFLKAIDRRASIRLSVFGALPAIDRVQDVL